MERCVISFVDYDGDGDVVLVVVDVVDITTFEASSG